MPNELITQTLLNRVRAAISEAFGPVAGLSHQGLKGRFREFLVSEIFDQLLPGNFATGKGIVVDQYGGQSPETDIIIYDRNDISPLLYSKVDGIFPIECCRYVIEVKSKLTSQEVESSIAKFVSLRSLRSMNTHPVTALIGYDTDLQKESDFERYCNIDKQFASSPAAQLICCFGRAYWYYWPESSGGRLVLGRWNVIKSNDQYIDVLGMIAGMLNTLNMRSPLGYYVLPPQDVPLAYFKNMITGIEIPPGRIEHLHEALSYERQGKAMDALNELELTFPNKRELGLYLSEATKNALIQNVMNLYRKRLKEIESI